MIDNNTNIESPEIYRLLFETSTEGILICDKKGIIRKVNQPLCDLFEYTKDELLNQPLEILIPKKLKEKHVEHRTGYIAKPTKRKMGAGRDLRGLTKYKNQIPIEISLNHVTLNEETYVMALISDISLRKQSEQAIQELNQQLEEKVDERTKELKESEKLYQLISRNFPNGTINVFDKDLNYVFVEGQELFKLGISSNTLMGTSYLDRIDKNIASQIKPKLLNVFKGNIDRFLLEDKGKVYQINAVPLMYSKDGEVEQILVVEQNITKEKKAEEQIKEALEKEKELNELKSRFVSMASHEFKTPLSTILSSASLIKRYDENGNQEKKDKHLYKIQNSVRNLSNMLDDILSISKLEEGRIEINPINFNLIELVEDVSSQFKDSFPNQNINHSHKGEITVYLDKKFLFLMISNIVSNGLKYSSGDIKIETKITLSNLTITIQDKGIGIPQEEQKQLFNRFFRAQNATNIQGTGLGLNIVKNYIELLKGEISINSEKDKGTTVIFELPIAKKNE